jgi:hypothetical protein
MMMTGTAGVIGIAAAIGMEWLWFTPAGIPERLEYLPAGIMTPVAQLAQTRPAQTPDGGMQFDFSDETVGSERRASSRLSGIGASAPKTRTNFSSSTDDAGSKANPPPTWRIRLGRSMASVTPSSSIMFKPTPTSPMPSHKGSMIFAGVRSASGSSRSPDASIRVPASCST